ncbi:MAG: Gfo/Idh/MocA family oxidoreductase [Flavobacteriaceae bacterium]
MEKKKYNVLIIGAGDIGSEYDSPLSRDYLTHAHAFTDHTGFNLIGFVDPNFESAKKASLKWNVDFFLTIDEAYSTNHIDVVSVAAPDEVHYSILKEIVKYKPNFVLAEKPLTLSVIEAKEIVEIYKRIPAIVNFKRRFIPEINSLKEKISNNNFGEFVFGTSYYGKGFKHNGSHLINLLLFLLENEWDYKEIIDRVIDYKEEDPTFSILLKDTKRETSFLIKAFNESNFSIFEFDLFFTKGRIRITDLGFTIEEHVNQKNQNFKGFTTLKKVDTYNTSLESSLLLTANHIYDHLINGTELYCTLGEVFKEMKFTEQIIKSI